jgi:superfamily II DNA helicase RecQ
MFNGHLPPSRLARLIRQDRSFKSRIRRVHIDEGHNIYTAGLSHHGEPAFRPAYGRLGDFRVLLPRGTPFQVLSATLPPHILAVVKRELNLAPDYLHIQLSTNRPNITYGATSLTTSLSNFHNLNFLLPPHLHPPMQGPKTLIFHDSKLEATNAALHVDSRLPVHLRNQGIVKHYHSDMSVKYLQRTYEDFSSLNGTCRILHATAGASTVS